MLNISDTAKRTAVFEALSAPVREIKNRVTFGHYEFKPDPNGTLGSRTEYGNLVSFTPKGGGISAITEIPLSDKGYDSISITRCGKNILDLRGKLSNANGITVKENADGTFTFNGRPKGNYGIFFLKENFPPSFGTYVLSQTNYGDAWNKGILLQVALEKSDGKKDYVSCSVTAASFKFDSRKYVKVLTNVQNAQITASPLFVNYKNGYQMEVGSKATPYEPYKGNTYTVNFPQKIYKGTYNWATGELNGFIGYPDLKPFKTTLTPQNIPALSGLNNVFSSVGTTRVTYSINASKRTFIGDKTIETMNARINQDGNGNPDGIAIGNSCVSSASCEFRNDDPKFLYSNKYAFFESGVKLKDGTFDFMPLGYFGCGKAETTNEGKTYKIDGYDDIYFMSHSWSPNISITENTSYLNLVEDIASRYGLELEYESVSVKNKLGSYKLINPNVIAKYTDREVLGFCAGTVGCNARMTTEGKLRVAWFGSPSFTIEPTVQWQEGFNKVDDVPFTLESITSGVDETVYTMGTGTGIEYANPLVNAAIVKEVYNKIVVNQKAQWQPSSCTWRGNPCIQAGDTVVIKDRLGKKHPIYIADQELELAGGLISRIECHSNEDKISFSTFEKDPGASLNKVYNDMHEAIAEATAMINGARGGYFKILGKENQPYGWQCVSTNGLDGVVCTYGGIGCTTDGGKTFKSALTSKGLVADMITIGRIRGPKSTFFIDMETGESSFSNMKATGIFTVHGKNYNLKVSNHTFYPGDDILEHDSLGLYKYDKSGNFDSAICFEDWTKERDPGISLITPKASAWLSEGGCVLTDDSNEADDSSWKNKVLLSLSKKPSAFNTGIKTGYDSDYVENAIDHMYGHWRKDNMGSEYINDSKITVSRKIQGSNSCPALDLKVEHVIYEQMGGLSPGEEVSAEMVLYTSDTNYKDPQTGSNANSVSLALYSCGVKIGHFTANINGSLYWNGKKIA